MGVQGVRSRLFRRTVMARFVAASLCSAAITGCVSIPVSAFDPLGTATVWHQYVTPRAPENPIEKGVVDVAETRKDSAVSGSDILFIADDVSKKKPVHCVDVVSKGPDTEAHPEKTVTRYRIVDGMIAAMTDPTEEFFVDAELERAVLKAVAKTWSPDPVIIYINGAHTMTIASHPLGDCTADVSIFEGETLTSPIASRKVAFCFAN